MVSADGQDLADLPPPWQAWLAQSVCPRARTARIFHASLRTMEPDCVLSVLTRFLAAGPPGRSAFVLVAEADGKDADEAERLSQGLFVRMLHALATLAGEDPALVVAQTELVSRLSGEPPILWFKDETFVTMAMSPHYPPSAAGPDPRYAPELCLVLTWSSDVVAAQGIRPGVGAEILRRRGHLYDADVLYDRGHRR